MFGEMPVTVSVCCNLWHVQLSCYSITYFQQIGYVGVLQNLAANQRWISGFRSNHVIKYT